jgi:DNA repair protein RadC
LNECIAHPREIFRQALVHSAFAVAVVHNHPSGDPTPSPEDVAFTRRVSAAAAIVGAPLLDHVVVAREGFSSVPFAVGAGEPAGAGVA